MDKNIIRVDNDNVHDVQRDLSRKGGYLLISEYPVCFHSAKFDFYTNARIRFDNSGGAYGPAITADVLPYKNREWILYEKYKGNKEDLSSALSEMFEKLPLTADYEFHINSGAQLAVYRGLYGYNKDNGKTLYLPDKDLKSVGEALEISLRHMVNNIDRDRQKWGKLSGIKEHHIQKIINYAIEDLKTGRIVKHNLEAGMEADNLSFGSI